MQKKWSASLTVESSYIIPLILWMILVVIYGGFYFHDKNIIHGAAYELSVIARQQWEKPEGVEVEELYGYGQEQMREKLLLFENVDISIEESGEEVRVELYAEKNFFDVWAVQITRYHHYEDDIRKINMFN